MNLGERLYVYQQGLSIRPPPRQQKTINGYSRKIVKQLKRSIIRARSTIYREHAYPAFGGVVPVVPAFLLTRCDRPKSYALHVGGLLKALDSGLKKCLRGARRLGQRSEIKSSVVAVVARRHQTPESVIRLAIARGASAFPRLVRSPPKPLCLPSHGIIIYEASS